MKDKIFGVLQRVGRSFMLPIAVLPVAGLPVSYTHLDVYKRQGWNKGCNEYWMLMKDGIYV